MRQLFLAGFLHVSCATHAHPEKAGAWLATARVIHMVEESGYCFEFHSDRLYEYGLKLAVVRLAHPQSALRLRRPENRNDQWDLGSPRVENLPEAARLAGTGVAFRDHLASCRGTAVHRCRLRRRTGIEQQRPLRFPGPSEPAGLWKSDQRWKSHQLYQSEVLRGANTDYTFGRCRTERDRWTRADESGLFRGEKYSSTPDFRTFSRAVPRGDVQRGQSH